MRCARGFTLLEVLVALAVLAISAAALIKQTGIGLQNAQRLEEKRHASALAEVAVNRILLAPELPPLGRSSDTEEYDGRSWQIEVEAAATARPDMHRIEVTVRPAESEEGAGIRLVAFKGLH